ncbi:hypothetical protein ACHHV8_23685 [Paenibacillus sp. TAB 01]|uniref:hypothetical protein n=1 Tax=Paenibacillus sp. TAB 01 TaxID=3368988 RepID=UPI003753C6FF
MNKTFDHIHFNLNTNVNNPLRIIFLCGSFFVFDGKEKDGRKDKRVVLRKYIEDLSPNFKCVILEDKFLFSNDTEKLNYNDIDFKSLKIIEVLTSIMSDKVMVFHESFSTAAEIGLFSGNTNITNKMVILAPDLYSIEEDVISGFLKLSYNNDYFKDFNIEILRYYPGVYNYDISENFRKYHTYFVGNEIGESLDKSLREQLKFETELRVKLSRRTNYTKKNYYSLLENNLNIVMETNNLIAYLMSLFTVKSVKSEMRTKRDDIDSITDSVVIRRKILFKVSAILKEYFNDYIVKSIRADNPSLEFEKYDIILSGHEVTLSKTIDYFVYIIFGIGLIKINEKKIVITTEMEAISANYSNLIVKNASGILSEVLDFE